MRKMGILRLFTSALIILTSISCSEFRKIQKSEDWQVKYDGAMKYYEEGDYFRSIALFEEVLPLTRGKTEGEKSQFYYAYAHYKDRQYVLSAHYFKTFYETYSRSELANEAQFMYAYSLYMDSPVFSLDQSNTRQAINAFQIMVNRNPNSAFAAQAIAIINELQVKLETKAFYNAKEYYKIGLLKSAIIAFDNFGKEYPDSDFNEELRYLKIEASYKLAQKSIPSKQKERYLEVIKVFEDFIDDYPETEFIVEGQRLYDNALNNLEKFKKLL
jgi:outer membrane protein assembly factor BamD